MNGAHDMGGSHGFGPVVPEMREPTFHENGSAAYSRLPWPQEGPVNGTSTWGASHARTGRLQIT